MIYSQTRAELQHPSTKDEYLVNDNSRNSSREDFFHHQFRREIGMAEFHSRSFSGSRPLQISQTKNEHLRFFNEISW